MNSQDHLAFLNSLKRRRILTLLDEEPASPGNLAQRGSISRPTVHRALTQCISWEWVTTDFEESTDENRPGTPQYTLSSAGQLIVDTWPLLGEQTATNPNQDTERDPKSDSDESLTSDEIGYLVGSTQR